MVSRAGSLATIERFAEIPLAAAERVWVTGDVHLDPDLGTRAELFLRFLECARAQADRICILGDLFDYWIGAEHARGCAYARVLEALGVLREHGTPVDFVCGNRDFLGPSELEAIGLRVHGDGLVYARGTQRTIVTHGDLLVAGDQSYKRYRRAVRSAPVRALYRVVPVAARLELAALIRRISRRKLGRIEAYAFPIDLELADAWLRRLNGQELLMGHLHREECHDTAGGRVAMLPAWSTETAPYFVVGPYAERCSIED